MSTLLSTAAGLTKPQVVSVGIETVYQNTALALSVALASPSPARAAAVPVFYQAVQVVTLFVYSITTWRLGWTFAPHDVPVWRMLATNYQPVFQKDTERVAEELRIAKTALKEAESEAVALGLRTKSFRKSSKSPGKSPATSRGASLRGGSHFAGLFRGGALRENNQNQNQHIDAALLRGGSGMTPEKTKPFGTPPKHRRTRSTPDGFGLGLGLGEIENEAAAAVGLWDETGHCPKTFSFAHSPVDSDLEKATGTEISDFVTPLKLRVKALEELNIRLARQSTRPATYWDFANVVQGTASSAGTRLAAAATAAVAAVRMSRIGSFISNAGSSPGGSLRGSRAGSVAGTGRGLDGDVKEGPPTPRGPRQAPPKTKTGTGKLNRVAPEP